MKGFTHFVTGITFASFFPHAVESGLMGDPKYFILGGLFGLMPDTLDFKFYRFFYRHDICIAPDPNIPSPGEIADAMVEAVNAAPRFKKPVRVKFETIRLATDLWQRYTVSFLPAVKSVQVSYGPIIDTGRNVVSSSPARMTRSGLELLSDKDNLVASREVTPGITVDYELDIDVEIFDGPLIEIEPTRAGVSINFIPWHRRWTHSLVICLLLCLIPGLFFGWLAAVIAFGAFALHIVVDQLGFMGSNLWFPFSRKRKAGAGIVNSGSGPANFFLIWFCCLIIFWNLSVDIKTGIADINLPVLISWGFGAPFLIWRLREIVRKTR